MLSSERSMPGRDSPLPTGSLFPLLPPGRKVGRGHAKGLDDSEQRDNNDGAICGPGGQAIRRRPWRTDGLGKE
jgi:hypothetical protein